MHNELVKFAQENYPEFASVPVGILHHWFETYKDTTIIDRNAKGQVIGFGIYQVWPDFLMFLIICGKQQGGSLDWFLNLCHKQFAGKKVAWFDEGKMEARFHVCR